MWRRVRLSISVNGRRTVDDQSGLCRLLHRATGAALKPMEPDKVRSMTDHTRTGLMRDGHDVLSA